MITFKCNCSYNKTDLKYRVGLKKKNGGYSKAGWFCPVHGKSFKHEISICVDCGCVIYNTRPSGRRAERCPKHAEKATTYSANLANDKAKSKGKKTTGIDVQAYIRDIKIRTPRRVRSIREAARHKVNCIPLEILFEKEETNEFNFDVATN